MKLLHAAALALVGWYLLVPPAHRERPGGPVSVEYSAPLFRWEPCDLADRTSGLGQTCQASYDTAAACEQGREKLLDRASDALSTSPDDKYGNLNALDEEAAYAKCIATDDPRLKEK